MELIKKDKKNELMELSDGNLDLLIELLGKYLENTPELLQKARDGIKNGDVNMVDYAVHTMKGSTLSLGLEPMGDFLVQLNQRTKKQDLDNMEESFRQIEAYLEDVKIYLQEMTA